jgi:hypothetical protein
MASLVLREDAGELIGGVDSEGDTRVRTRSVIASRMLYGWPDTLKWVREQYNQAGAIPVRSI